MSRIKVLLADCYQMEREALQAVLEEAGFEVVGHAATPRSTIDFAKLLRPDVAVLGTRLPEMGAVATGRLLSGLDTPIRWLLLASSAEEKDMAEAMLAGASAYVPRLQSVRELVHGLIEAVEGRLYIAPGVRGLGRIGVGGPAPVS